MLRLYHKNDFMDKPKRQLTPEQEYASALAKTTSGFFKIFIKISDSQKEKAKENALSLYDIVTNSVEYLNAIKITNEGKVHSLDVLVAAQKELQKIHDQLEKEVEKKLSGPDGTVH
jgi:membrane-associated HD superfamily phosphohydrolase